ncbi:MAG: hypothetical protein IMZ44_12590 [Planctomycetes bacterium]|nr:hypothetical protein [Planctomycetota bacterium]
MTGKQPIWFAVIAAAAAAVLVALHLVLPINASWQVNRILHYAWMAVVALATAGGIVWLMWPRPKARRRDFDRAAARRRVIGVGAVVLAAVAFIIFGEMHREVASREYLEPAAAEDLQAIAQALGAYAAEHGGARPAAIEALVPKHLAPARLYFAYRRGPASVEPPQPAAEPVAQATAPASSGPGPGAGQGATEPPSYALVRQLPGSATAKRSPADIVAYLRPGNAWAPLTVIVEESGRGQVVSDDAVRTFERRLEAK